MRYYGIEGRGVKDSSGSGSSNEGSSIAGGAADVKKVETVTAIGSKDKNLKTEESASTKSVGDDRANIIAHMKKGVGAS